MKRLIVSLYFIAVFASAVFANGTAVTGSGNLVTKEFDILGFSSVDTSGSWKVTISEGPFKVSIEVDDNILEYVKVEKRGNALHFSTKSVRLMNGTFNAVISMPNLNKISSSGSSRISFSGLSGPELTITTSGSSQIAGQNGSFDELDVSISGSGDLDMTNCPVNDAKINISGSATILLNMTGGALTGRISGSGSVFYKGEISSQNISMSGSGKVIKQ